MLDLTKSKILFARRLPKGDYDIIRNMHVPLGPKDLEITAIYIHVFNKPCLNIKTSAD